MKEIPKKRFLSYVLLLFPNVCAVPFLRTFVMKFGMPHVTHCYIEPGFRFYYGNNVYARDAALSNVFLMDYGKITIGAGTTFAKDCKVITAKHEVGNRQNIIVEPVSIGKNVVIGVNTLILSGVTIGDDCVIGAGSVVTHDIADRSLAAGNPANIIKKITHR